MAKKAKSKAEAKSSVKSYQQGIDTEKQKMGAYAKSMGTRVRSLRGEFKEHSKDMEKAARNMVEEGSRKMNIKVGKFQGEIKNQLKENKEAVSRIENSVKFFLSEVNKKKKDFQAYAKGSFTDGIKGFHSNIDKEKKAFQAYAHGPFQSSIKAFWG